MTEMSEPGDDGERVSGGYKNLIPGLSKDE